MHAMFPSTTRRSMSTHGLLLLALRAAALVAVAGALLLSSGCTKKLNHAAYFGWGGYADTDLEMADFFGGNHTLTAWFMPQYPRVHIGPIISNSGSAVGDFPNFYVGLGDFWQGQMVTDPNTGNPVTGQPLVLKVGSQRARFTPDPPLEAETWYHLAVTRTGCTFRLYLNGELLTPDAGGDGLTVDCSVLFGVLKDLSAEFKGSLDTNDEVEIGPVPEPLPELAEADPFGGDTPVDVGTGFDPADTTTVLGEEACSDCGVPGVRPELLRIGRAEDGYKYRYQWDNDGNPNYYLPQFYGLIDDVAVFSRALSQAEIASLVANRRLSGSESGLLAGWTFDSHTPSGSALPPTLDREVKFYSKISGLVPVGRTLVSQGRDSSIDVDFLPLPFHRTVHRLPFAPGQPWLVIQEYGGSVSHNGIYAFCYDFSTYDENGNASYGQSVYASSAGQLESISPGSPSCDNGNASWRSAPGESTSYLHLMYNPTLPLSIQAGDTIHQLGKYKSGSCTCCTDNSHLHFATRRILRRMDASVDEYNTFPIAFSNYEVAPDPDGPWSFVARGVPRQGQWIRTPEWMALKSGSLKSPSLKSILVPVEGAADLAVDLSAELATDIGTMRAESRMGAKMSGQAHVELEGRSILVRELALSVRDLRPDLRFQLDSRLIPYVPLRTRAWTLQLRSAEPFRGEVQADGSVVFGDVPVEMQADVTLGACVLGSFDVEINEPLSIGLSGVLRSDGELVQLQLSLDGRFRVDIPRSDLPPGIGATRMSVGLASADLVLGGYRPADDGAARPAEF